MNDDGIVTEKVIQLPGVDPGLVGTAGIDRPGPSTRVVAVNPFVYIGVEIAWTYLHAFLGLLAIDGLGLADLAPPGEAFTHLWHIGGLALAPTMMSLLHELYQYLGKVRAAQVR